MIVGRTINYRMLRNPVAAHRARRSIWTPAALFAQGQQGAWYEPKPQYLFQDAAGTVPVTADGDPVGLMLDRSGSGNHARQSLELARPRYRTDGVLHWLEFDGVDDFLNVQNGALFQSTDSPVMAVVGVRLDDPNGGSQTLFGNMSNTFSDRIFAIHKGGSSNDFYVNHDSAAILGAGQASELSSPGVVTVSKNTGPRADMYARLNGVVKTNRGDTQNRSSQGGFVIGRSFHGVFHANVSVYGMIFTLTYAPNNQISVVDSERYIATLAGVTL